MDTKLSNNFWLSEFQKSNIATRLGIDNTVPIEYIPKLMDLCRNVLQPCRDHFKSAVRVSSGFRSKALNDAIQGSYESQHSKGEAADFEIPGVSNYLLAKYIQDNLEFDQLILEFHNLDDPYSGWVHCSYKEGANRKEVLRAYKNSSGKTKYERITL